MKSFLLSIALRKGSCVHVLTCLHILIELGSEQLKNRIIRNSCDKRNGLGSFGRNPWVVFWLESSLPCCNEIWVIRKREPNPRGDLLCSKSFQPFCDVSLIWLGMDPETRTSFDNLLDVLHVERKWFPCIQVRLIQNHVG